MTTIERLESVLREYTQVLDPQHGLVMSIKRSLLQCLSQVSLHDRGETKNIPDFIFSFTRSPLDL